MRLAPLAQPVAKDTRVPRRGELLSRRQGKKGRSGERESLIVILRSVQSLGLALARPPLFPTSSAVARPSEGGSLRFSQQAQPSTSRFPLWLRLCRLGPPR